MEDSNKETRETARRKENEGQEVRQRVNGKKDCK